LAPWRSRASEASFRDMKLQIGRAGAPRRSQLFDSLFSQPRRNNGSQFPSLYGCLEISSKFKSVPNPGDSGGWINPFSTRMGLVNSRSSQGALNSSKISWMKKFGVAILR
jgi:hypothetical protein